MRASVPASLLVLLLSALAPAAPATPRPEFGDVPIDRVLRGEILEMKGRRIKIRYDFQDPEQAKDFYYSRPFQREGMGRFEIVDGRLLGLGGGGFVLTAAFEPDVTAEVTLQFGRPTRDAGIFLHDRKGPLRATLFTAIDTFFSRKDNQQLGDHTINEVGGVGNPLSGVIEYLWISRSGSPVIDEGQPVLLHVERKGKKNSFRIGKTEMGGNDVGTPLDEVEVGFLTNGGRATFDDLVIEGTLSKLWLAERRIALFLEKDLENPGNGLKAPDLAALALRKGIEQDKGDVGEALRVLGDSKVIVFVREKLAEALAASARVAETLDLLEPLLGSDEIAARTFGSRLLAKATTIDFGYDPGASPPMRQEALARVRDYVEHRSEREARGQAFVGGAWRTPEELEALRLTWQYAREIATDHFFLRANVTAERAEDISRLLEAAYDAFRQFLGREPTPERLPLRIFVFARNEEYARWCKETGRERFASFNRLIVGEEGLGLVSWQFQANEGVLNVTARLFDRATFGCTMPMWYEEGIAAYFSMPGAHTWISGQLTVGKRLTGNELNRLKAAAGKEEWLTVERLVELQPAEMAEPAIRKNFYAETWGLITFLMESDAYNSRWTEFVARCRAASLSEENRRLSGAQIFRESFEGKLESLEKDFVEWARNL